jgi:phage-related protein
MLTFFTMKWTISYYSQATIDGIAKWPKKMRAKFLRILDLIELNGPQLGEPITKALGRGLFEIRVKAQEGIGRVFYCYMVKHEIIVLHSFIKKTQKTPKKELELAIERMKEVKINEAY